MKCTTIKLHTWLNTEYGHIHEQHQTWVRSKTHYSRTLLLCSYNLRFLITGNIFSGPFSFHTFIMHCLPLFYVSEISNFQRGTSLECLEKEQFWHKVASAERTSAIYIFWAFTERTVLTQNGACWEIACICKFCHILLSPSVGQQSS
jgi:hypothetical protein